MKTTRTDQITNLQTHLTDTVVDVYHVIVIQIARFRQKTDIIPILDTDIDMTELLLLPTITGQDMIIIDETHVLIVHHTDLLIDHHLDEIHALDIDHVHTPKMNLFHNILHHLDLLKDQKTLDFLDLDQILKRNLK